MSGFHPEGRGTPKGTPAKRESHERLEERTREELYALGRQLQIPGCMEMTREELIEAIRRR